jgi:hypothetical protein
MSDFDLALSPNGKFIHFRPFKASATEPELLRRWSMIAAYGRRHGVYRILFDHRESPPPENVDMISAALRNPEWREDETWRVAILGSPAARDHIQFTLESTAEFVSAIHQRAAAFFDLAAAEQWLGQDSQ